jgi:dephospho-CoA kinase
MRLIGVTGGIATGKTTVDRMLTAHGATVIDADELAREVVRPGEPALEEVAARFGRDLIRPDGSLDRTRLGRLVFADPEARRDLERITHPRITELTAARVATALAGPAPLVVVDIPLLFENAREAMFEGVLLVYAPAEVQVERLRERNGLDEAAALQRLAAQLPIDEKRGRATWIIDNSGSLDATSRAVDHWWETEVR